MSQILEDELDDWLPLLLLEAAALCVTESGGRLRELREDVRYSRLSPLSTNQFPCRLDHSGQNNARLRRCGPPGLCIVVDCSFGVHGDPSSSDACEKSKSSVRQATSTFVVVRGFSCQIHVRRCQSTDRSSG